MTPSEQSVKYSKKVKRNLCLYLQQSFKNKLDYGCFAITGSFAKDQGTPNSDVDLLAIADTDDHVKEIKQRLKQSLAINPFSHPVEFYPFETLDSWQDISNYSLLYGSDLYFAQFLCGNQDLFKELNHYINNDNRDLKNQINYGVYNILYRDRQYKKYAKSKNFRYQPGGWRDMQFIKWLVFRRGKDRTNLPANYLKTLLNLNYINSDEYELLCQYSEAIIANKWQLEVKNKFRRKSRIEAYDNLRLSILPIVEQLKKKLLSEFEKDLGFNWRQMVNRTRSGNLADKEIKSLITQKNQTESLIFCATLSTKSESLLTIIYNDWKQYWSIRMALAINRSTPKAIRKQLMSDLSDENSDIRKILSSAKSLK